MAVFSNPSRAQFERLLVAGQEPSVGQPGAFALNLIDRKLWTFDETGAPALLAYNIEAHSPAKRYVAGQLVLQDGALWQANAPIGPAAFNPANWTPVSADSLLPPPEASSSGVLTGGGIGLSGGNISVSAGTGVIVNATDPAANSRTLVSWGAQSVSISGGGAALRAVTVDSSGSIGSELLTQMQTVRRQFLVLGYVEFNAAGTLVRVINAPRVARQAAEDLADTAEALGGAFIVEGLALSAGTGLTLNLASGQVFTPQGRWRNTPSRPNRAAITGANAISFDVKRLSGEIVLAAQTLVPTDLYDGGFIPNGFSAVVFMFTAIDGSYRWAQLGQSVYPSSAEATSALYAEWAALPLELRQRPDALTVGAVVVTRTTLTDLDGRVFSATIGPQIRADFRIPQGASGFLRTDGLSVMQGPLDMGGNNVQNSVIDEGVF
jgi:hypothetical protein